MPLSRLDYPQVCRRRGTPGRPRSRTRQRVPFQAHRSDEGARRIRDGHPGGVRRNSRFYRLLRLITSQLVRGWMSLAGAVCGHGVVAKLIGKFGIDEHASGLLRRWRPGDPGRGAHRARRRLLSPGDAHDGPSRRCRLRGQRQQDVDHQCPALAGGGPALQDRSGR